MQQSNPETLAAEVSVMAVRLIRWLRAVDPAPAFSPAEASAMAVIIYAGGITPSQLADFEQVRRPTIARLVDGLLQRGLVERREHPSDKRSAILHPTAKGVQVWEEGQRRRVAPLAARIAALSAPERERFADALPLLDRLTAPPSPADAEESSDDI